jgi:hypothetical protein
MKSLLLMKIAIYIHMCRRLLCGAVTLLRELVNLRGFLVVENLTLRPSSSEEG